MCKLHRRVLEAENQEDNMATELEQIVDDIIEQSLENDRWEYEEAKARLERANASITERRQQLTDMLSELIEKAKGVKARP
jgi:hypothetical protein